MHVGDVVTLADSGAVGTEKSKDRPAVIVLEIADAFLVAPITDANKRMLPTHHCVRNYNSGSEVKDALITTEHARVVPRSALSARRSAQSLSRELKAIRSRLRIALGLDSVRNPPTKPNLCRMGLVDVDFGTQPARLVTGVVKSVIVSNDQGNSFGQHFLVIPSVPKAAASTVAVKEGGVELHFDLAHMRVVDVSRIKVTRALPIAGASETILNNALSRWIPA